MRAMLSVSDSIIATFCSLLHGRHSHSQLLTRTIRTRACILRVLRPTSSRLRPRAPHVPRPTHWIAQNACFGLIRKLNNVEPLAYAEGIYSYSDSLEVVGVAAVQAVVGRVSIKGGATGDKRWYLIDSSGPLAQVEYINEDI
ncbi:hypothetical protein BOTBODRAFT_28440 [Botryobasidium botryosum FD-172 SS1]|uniref:Uncharacterized protein n=1 Tax=Botryobasidium botryosum (strain FD-172 SS1) TaxID=930990 RepID=A0A067N4A5_BOTB1|nr:hypothetical protein BOTBODRAFT_28440 [Botryobasidium botryosum FD-172 SS1]